jgi:hypothetical protein
MMEILGLQVVMFKTARSETNASGTQTAALGFGGTAN